MSEEGKERLGLEALEQEKPDPVGMLSGFTDDIDPFNFDSNVSELPSL